jgi:hypothetical protein
VTEVSKQVEDYAARAVEYVRRAVGLEITFDSDTLPLLDHYLRSVPGDQPATVELVAATSGAYFGEVVRRLIGGRWELDDDPLQWRMTLPTGLTFSPAGFVAAAIAQAELEDIDTEIDAPPRMRPYVAQALERMGEVSVEEYYSLCGRLDTIEHLHEVLVGVAARLLGEMAADGRPPGADAPQPPEGEGDADEPAAEDGADDDSDGSPDAAGGEDAKLN